MIIGVTGTNGAGKGTVVEYLVREKGFKHYSVREQLVKEIEKRGLPVHRPTMREVANELREKNGPEYFDRFFLEDAKKNGYTDILIESVRVVASAKWLKEHGAYLFAVDADRKLRYERVVSRGSHTDKVDFDTWVAEEEREWHNEAAHDMNVPAVMKMADVTLHNDGIHEELYTQIDQALLKISKK
jgi:dephospho-CoA kinase